MPLVVFACRGLSSLPGYYTRSLFDGKFRGFAANLDAFMAKCRFFGGGWRPFSLSVIQVLALLPNGGKAKRVQLEGTESLQIVSAT